MESRGGFVNHAHIPSLGKTLLVKKTMNKFGLTAGLSRATL
jgi:hypothetical protein